MFVQLFNEAKPYVVCILVGEPKSPNVINYGFMFLKLKFCTNHVCCLNMLNSGKFNGKIVNIHTSLYIENKFWTGETLMGKKTPECY